MPANPMDTIKLSEEDLTATTSRTLANYESRAPWFWEGTKDHDVVQNIEAVLRHIQGDAPFSILDFGCGPGRDLLAFKERGHTPVGLEGCASFVEMAKNHSGCDVLHQDFLKLELPEEFFDGIFANASIFHVPSQELPRVLKELWASLKENGVFFSSNPRGGDVEGWNGERYGSYMRLESYRSFLNAAGFDELEHYYRPPGRPREEQPWLASVWRKRS